MNIGLVTQIRKDVFSLLEKTPSIGGLSVEVHKMDANRNFAISPQETWEKYRNTYFCPILEGDKPYQKRFFDVALSGCLPVVLTFPTGEDISRGRSWFKRGWPGYKDTYPFPASIDYSEFVVEIENIDELVPKLESLLANKSQIQVMQSALRRVAPKFVYGLGDEFMVPGDAFDSLLKELEHYILHLGDEKQQPAAKDKTTHLDYCHECLFAAGITCAARLNFVLQKYGGDQQEAIRDIIQNQPHCKAID